jgi:hypothetical protein
MRVRLAMTVLAGRTRHSIWGNRVLAQVRNGRRRLSRGSSCVGSGRLGVPELRPIFSLKY